MRSAFGTLYDWFKAIYFPGQIAREFTRCNRDFLGTSMYRIIGYAKYDYLTPGRALNAFCPVSLLANRSIGRTPFDSTQYSVVYYFPFTRNVASFPGCVGSFSADDAVARLHFRDTEPAAIEIRVGQNRFYRVLHFGKNITRCIDYTASTSCLLTKNRQQNFMTLLERKFRRGAAALVKRFVKRRNKIYLRFFATFKIVYFASSVFSVRRSRLRHRSKCDVSRFKNRSDKRVSEFRARRQRRYGRVRSKPDKTSTHERFTRGKRLLPTTTVQT